MADPTRAVDAAKEGTFVSQHPPFTAFSLSAPVRNPMATSWRICRSQQHTVSKAHADLTHLIFWWANKRELRVATYVMILGPSGAYFPTTFLPSE
jgi:hypothetical protein